MYPIKALFYYVFALGQFTKWILHLGLNAGDPTFVWPNEALAYHSEECGQEIDLKTFLLQWLNSLKLHAIEYTEHVWIASERCKRWWSPLKYTTFWNSLHTSYYCIYLHMQWVMANTHPYMALSMGLPNLFEQIVIVPACQFCFVVWPIFNSKIM